MEGRRKYMNPYLAGTLLGLVILFSFYFTREGLGASGAMKRTVANIERYVAPAHINNPDTYFHKYVKHGKNPLKNRLVYMVLGIFVGGFISGGVHNRLKLRLQHHPNITAKKRAVFALIGGILFGIGASFARGCTSGAGLTAMAAMTTAGFVTVAAIFGFGYLFAWFFRKLWV